MDIEKKVLLLAISKMKDDETFTDILITLENTKVFTLKQGQKYLKELKNENFIDNNSLTFAGVAKLVEEEFRV